MIIHFTKSIFLRNQRVFMSVIPNDSDHHRQPTNLFHKTDKDENQFRIISCYGCAINISQQFLVVRYSLFI